ncbi:MAG TPA: DUF1538 domain-containing protein [Gammaproteobacteria bacterium]
MELLGTLWAGTVGTVSDLVPIAVLFAIFQFVVLRKPLPDLGRISIGLFYVVVGLTLFRVGLGVSLIPTGASMARQLASLEHPAEGWTAYLPIVLFAGSIGFTATLIEPTLIAVANRVRDLSGGTVQPWTLRIVIALGVAGGLTLGTLRIVLGVPFELVITAMVILIALLVLGAPRTMVPLALDSGAIATSVVTVPLIAAYGIALAETLPGRSVLIDGFGLIIMALLGPAVTLLLFAQAYRLYQNWLKRGENRAV